MTCDSATIYQTSRQKQLISEREADNPLRDRPHVHDVACVDGGVGVAGVRRAAGLRVGAAAHVGAVRQDQRDLQQNQGIHQGRNGKESYS